MHFTNKEHRPLLYFLSLVAIIRLLVAPNFALGVDESHYVLYALQLDWSYFDHPPMIGWLQYIFTSIFGVTALGARISAIVLGFATSLFVYLLLYQISANAKASFIAIVALNAMFVFNALFLLLMPDTLLFFIIVPLMFAVIHVEKENSPKSWFILAIWMGLAGLSKYTAILFLPPIILYFLIKKRYELFYSPNILMAIGVALFIISPVLYWNSNHDWISFSYQSNHVVGASHIDWKSFFISLAREFGAYNPLLFPVAFYGVYKAVKSKNDLLFLSALFSIVLFLFFAYSSLYKTALPHWSALFYLLSVPIGSYYLYEKSNTWRRYLKVAIAFGITLSLLIYIEIATKIVPLPNIKSLQVDIYGFEKIMKHANAQIKDSTKEFIGVTNWTLASRAILDNKPYKSEVFLLDNRYDQFDIWEKSSPIGKDIVVIDMDFAHKDLQKYMKCDSITPLESFNLLDEKSQKSNIHLLQCKNYQGIR